MRRVCSLVFIVMVGCLIAAWRPAQTDDPTLRRGGRLYDFYCSSCHGPDASGPLSALASLVRQGSNQDAYIAEVITNGLERMPAWGEEQGGPLTADDVDAVVVYANYLLLGNPPLFPKATPTPAPFLSGPLATAVANFMSTIAPGEASDAPPSLVAKFSPLLLVFMAALSVMGVLLAIVNHYPL